MIRNATIEAESPMATLATEMRCIAEAKPDVAEVILFEINKESFKL